MIDLTDTFALFLNHPDIVKPPNHAGEARAWCPWHSDRAGGNPSLGINVKKRAVKCWVCGRGSIRELVEAWELGTPPADRTLGEGDRGHLRLPEPRWFIALAGGPVQDTTRGC